MTSIAAPADPLLETDFIREMVRQMRALDSYGQYDGKPATSLLEPFVLSKERKAEIPIIGDPDDLTLACIKAFYNGIAVLIEKECGLMAVTPDGGSALATGARERAEDTDDGACFRAYAVRCAARSAITSTPACPPTSAGRPACPRCSCGR